jgi:hypothetical protein
MGLFSRFLYDAPSGCRQMSRAQFDSALQRERYRCRTPNRKNSVSIFIEPTAARVPRFSPLVDVLTFFGLITRQTPNFAYSTSKTK